MSIEIFCPIDISNIISSYIVGDKILKTISKLDLDNNNLIEINTNGYMFNCTLICYGYVLYPIYFIYNGEWYKILFTVSKTFHDSKWIELTIKSKTKCIPNVIKYFGFVSKYKDFNM